MRSPYGRIFAQPEQPDTTADARHGDLWVSPLGLYFFSRSPAQASGVWTAVQVQPIAADVAVAVAGANAVASTSLALSGTVTLNGPAVGSVIPTTIVLSGLSAQIIALTPVVAQISTNTSTLTLGAVAGSAGGTITFNFAAGAIATGQSITITFYATP